VNFSKSDLIVLLSSKPHAFEERFGSINWVIQLTCLCRVVWRSILGRRTE